MFELKSRYKTIFVFKISGEFCNEMVDTTYSAEMVEKDVRFGEFRCVMCLPPFGGEKWNLLYSSYNFKSPCPSCNWQLPFSVQNVPECPGLQKHWKSPFLSLTHR